MTRFSIPKYKLKEKEYTYYADDTHSGGRILNSKFEIIPTSRDGLRPYTFCAGLLIETKKEEAFFRGFDDMRRRFAQYLNMSELPIIHMRQIWGKTPPDGPEKNPFYHLDFETRFLWAREILEYLCEGSKYGIEGFSAGMLDLPIIQDSSSKFHKTVTMVNENKILVTKFKHHMKGFYNIILNPLPFGIASSILDVDTHLRTFGGEATFVYDSPEGSKGFDILESYATAKSVGYLSKIKQVIPSNTRRHTGLQCADVIAYIQQREKHAAEFDIHDDGIFRLTDGLSIPIFMRSDPRSENELKRDLISVANMLHYELGVSALKKVDDQWVEQNMYSPAEILHRTRTGTRFGDLQSGTNLVRDEVHAAWARSQ